MDWYKIADHLAVMNDHGDRGYQQQVRDGDLKPLNKKERQVFDKILNETVIGAELDYYIVLGFSKWLEREWKGYET